MKSGLFSNLDRDLPRVISEILNNNAKKGEEV